MLTVLHMYTYTYIHTFIHIYMWGYACFLFIYICAYIHTWYLYMHMCAHIHTCTYIINMYAHTHLCLHMCMDMYTNKYMPAHIDTFFYKCVEILCHEATIIWKQCNNMNCFNTAQRNGEKILYKSYFSLLKQM